MSANFDLKAAGVCARHEMDAALLRGAVMLTPHASLAAAESAGFDAARHAEGKRLWTPASILPWRAWTASLWRDALVAGVDARVLLNDLQERALWEKVIQADSADTLRSTASLTRLCSSATRLLGGYDLTGAFSAFRHAVDGMSDATTFARWWMEFERRCNRDELLPSSHVEVALADHILDGRTRPASEYLLHGFDLLTPSQAHLLGALQAAGAAVLRTSTARKPIAPPMLATCDSPDDELARCAAWARRALEEPGARVAIVVPDLAECRPVVERALRAFVAPELADVTDTAGDAPYDFSAGRKLGTLPLVEDALRLLRWCAGEISVDDAGAVLRSPYLSLALTPERGAELDAYVLRDKPALRALVSMTGVARWIEKTDSSTAIALRTLFAAARNNEQRSKNHAFFADAVRSLLRSAGWPGGALSSGESGAADQWDEALDRVASLDALGLRVTFGEFVEKLADACGDTTVALENTNAPLQVTSIAEAVGRDVDALWFMHAEDRTWPPRQRPHPLLPVALQRDLQMPGADTRRDEDAARQLLADLMGGAAAVVLSYALMSGETAHRASPLVMAVEGLVPMPVGVIVQSGEQAELEEVEDVAEVPALPEGIVPGGVGVLSAQALCGFRAFAEKRLFSREMEANAAGLTAGKRGEQVHSVLEAFWRETKDQAQLKAMSADIDSNGVSQRDLLLRECIEAAIPLTSHDAWETSYLEVQRRRLELLLTAWLDAESARPPFRVEALEMKIAGAAVGPLRLDLRVDRIDRVMTNGDEAALLIDYKTGSAVHSKTEWMGERLSEPQLPLYAVAGGIENVQAIAFGAVKVGTFGNKFETMAEDPKILSSKAASVDFEWQVETWRNDLTQLAADFAEGRADVAPKDYPKTCDLCGQRMLCRLDAATLLDVDDVDDDDDEEVMTW